jgi:two-component system, OmpR family, sensor histidine kinase SenX3
MPLMISAVAGSVLLLLVVWVRARRRLVRRVLAVGARLDGDGTGMEGRGGLERALARMERAAERDQLGLDSLTSARNRLSAAYSELDEGVVVVDERGEWVLRNRAAEELGMTDPGDDPVVEAAGDLLDRALRGRAGEKELRLFGPPRRVVHLRSTPLDDGTRPVGAVVFLKDVSEARRVEAMRRDFVANVGHELKSPIGALGLLAETMVSERDTRTVRRLAGRLLQEAHRLERVVEDLLDLTLLEAQEGPHREVVPVTLLMTEAIERLAVAAEAAGIALEMVEVAGDPAVACDRGQVVSALFNILDNAVKYSEEGGKVVLRAEVEGGEVVLSVSDHGIGIPAGEVERIFERFYRVDRARSRATGGTGLGLTIVRHVAHAHGGEVVVESSEGRGSTFRLRLPLGTGSRRRRSRAS